MKEQFIRIFIVFLIGIFLKEGIVAFAQVAEPEVVLELENEDNYLKEKAIVIATIKEKYLDTDSIQVHVNEEGKNYTLTLGKDQKLMNQEKVVEGISYEWKDDTQELTLIFYGEKEKQITYKDVEVSCLDKAGNKSSGSLSHDFSIDRRVATIDLDIEKGNTYYQKSATITVTITERFLKKENLTISLTEEEEEKKYTLDNEESGNLSEEISYQWKTTDSTDVVKLLLTFKTSEKESSKRYHDITFRYLDDSDLENEKTITKKLPQQIVLDNKSPVIEWNLPNQLVYEKKDTTVTVTFTERYLDEESIRLNFYYETESKMTSLSLKDLNSNNYGISYQWKNVTDKKKDTSQSVLLLIFAGESSDTKFSSTLYKNISITCTDMAKNTASITDSEASLVVDKIKPMITQTINKASKNTKYYRKNAIVTVEIIERYLEESNLKIHLSVDGVEGEYSLTDTLPNEIKCSKEINKDTEKDQTTSTLIFTFSKDGDYTFSISCSDKAGNQQSSTKALAVENSIEEITEFIVDKTAPQIEIQFVDTDNTQKASQIALGDTRIYDSTNAITASIEVKEKNLSFQNGDIQTEFLMTDSKGEEVSSSNNYEKILKSKKKWVTNRKSSRNKISLKFKQEANYTWKTLMITDLAGNKTVYVENNKTYQFTIDRSNPTGSITYQNMVSDGIDTNTWNNNQMFPIWYELFSRQNVLVSYEKSDKTAGIASCKFYVAFEKVSLSELKKVAWKKELSKLLVNRQAIVYMRLEDRAGNIVYYNADGIILDDEQGIIVFTMPKDSGNGIYNTDVDVNVQIKDKQAKDGSYAGLHSVKWSVLKDGIETQSETITYPKKSHQLQDEITIPIEAKKNNSNDVTVKVIAVDNAGNTVEEEEKDIKIDIDKPIVTIDYSNITPQNNQYYKDTYIATITVKERNFDEQEVYFTDLKEDNYSVSSWSHHGETHTANVTFDKDGDYQFQFFCIDLATNQSETVSSDEFTVDKTLPQIHVVYDKNETNSYYQDSRQATITVTEHNFDENNVVVTITKKKDGEKKVQKEKYNNRWDTKGDIHKASYTFEEEAQYTLTISCTDLAGNISEQYQVDSFFIDKTDPKVTISNVKNHCGYNGKVQPTITCEDINYKENGLAISLVYRPYDGKNVKTSFQSYEKNYTKTPLSNSHGQSCVYENITQDLAHDGYYKLTVQAVDKAGRKSKKQVVEFTINRYGSYYELENKEMSQYLSNPQDIVLRETNIDEIKEREVSYTLNGKTVQLIEGTQYQVKTINNKEDEWKQYQYIISKENFTQQGAYVVTVYSKDEHQINTNTNTSENKAGKKKSQKIEFVIDREAPQGSIIGLENGKTYRQTGKDFWIRCKDNNEYIQKLEVIVNGTSTIYNSKELLENHNQVMCHLDESSKIQSVSFKVWDLSGRTYELPEEVHVWVTTSKWIQFKNNIILFYSTLIIIGIIILFFIRKKRQLLH